jgi:hypothetical protein
LRLLLRKNQPHVAIGCRHYTAKAIARHGDERQADDEQESHSPGVEIPGVYATMIDSPGLGMVAIGGRASGLDASQLLAKQGIRSPPLFRE